ncbi:MAG: ABC transporter permease [Bacteroidetes bacterium]|nr:ABC transporter permease [Bacteroidota bacterium]
MLKHQLLIAIRNLRRHKASFIINLVGLSTGLACAILIFLWVNDELHFDAFHANDKNLYQVMELSTENNAKVVHEATQGLLADAMAKDLPEVQAATSIMSLQKEGFLFNVKTPEKTIKKAGIFASNNFFSVFSFPLLQGNPQQVLAGKNNVVISQSLAKDLFGNANAAIGKSVEWELAGMIKRQALVSGVFENTPANSSLQFDFVLTHEMLLSDVWPNGQNWYNEGPQTYVLLKPGTNSTAFNSKIAAYIKHYNPDTQFSLFTRKFSSGYLYGKYENGVQAGGRIGYVRMFIIIALFILFIACINFMNLSTARASRRMKEVGIKKAVGSSRKQLVLQFLGEALLMSFIALLIALLMVVLLLPVFNNITGKQIVFAINAQWILMLIAATAVTGLVSGSYPAFYLSGFKAVAVLKGKIKTATGELLARKGLVVFQFAVSLVLIVSVLVIHRQVNYIQNKDLGYSKNGVIQFDKEGTVATNTTAFLQELKKQPGVVDASAASQSAVQSTNNSTTYGIEWPGKDPNNLVNFIVRNVDYDLTETLGIQMKEGRSFSAQYGADSTKLVFNEAAIKAMGLKNPVGTKVRMWQKDMEIIGVMKDFHVASLYDQIAPMVFRYDPSRTTLIIAKLQPGTEKATLDHLQQFYKSYNPGYVLNYTFLDTAYQAQYVTEQRVAALSDYFAALAILISCLGLFGLAAFNAEARTKEIGIRKVLGASVTTVMYILSKDFIKLIILAMLLAFPMAWWAMNKWLNGFAYKIPLSISVFAVALVAVCVITMIIVGYQAAKAAVTNPVKSLRSE